MSLSLGIGLTNACNLQCGNCYRSTDAIHFLSFGDIKRVCEHLPISSMGMGTGENSLHPQFCEIVEYVRQ